MNQQKHIADSLDSLPAKHAELRRLQTETDADLAACFATLMPSGTTAVDPRGPLEFALAGAVPNPGRAGRLSVSFALAGDAPATLELLDVGGRRVASRAVGSLGAGRHTVDLASGARIAPGLYLVRLAQGAQVRVVRVAVLD